MMIIRDIPGYVTGTVVYGEYVVVSTINGWIGVFELSSGNLLICKDLQSTTIGLINSGFECGCIIVLYNGTILRIKIDIDINTKDMNLDLIVLKESNHNDDDIISSIATSNDDSMAIIGYLNGKVQIMALPGWEILNEFNTGTGGDNNCIQKVSISIINDNIEIVIISTIDGIISLWINGKNGIYEKIWNGSSGFKIPIITSLTIIYNDSLNDEIYWACGGLEGKIAVGKFQLSSSIMGEPTVTLTTAALGAPIVTNNKITNIQMDKYIFRAHRSSNNPPLAGPVGTLIPFGKGKLLSGGQNSICLWDLSTRRRLRKWDNITTSPLQSIVDTVHLEGTSSLLVVCCDTSFKNMPSTMSSTNPSIPSPLGNSPMGTPSSAPHENSTIILLNSD